MTAPTPPEEAEKEPRHLRSVDNRITDVAGSEPPRLDDGATPDHLIEAVKAFEEANGVRPILDALEVLTILGELYDDGAESEHFTKFCVICEAQRQSYLIAKRLQAFTEYEIEGHLERLIAELDAGEPLSGLRDRLTAARSIIRTLDTRAREAEAKNLELRAGVDQVVKQLSLMTDIAEPVLSGEHIQFRRALEHIAGFRAGQLDPAGDGETRILRGDEFLALQQLARAALNGGVNG